jgi:hypothetical protein
LLFKGFIMLLEIEFMLRFIPINLYFNFLKKAPKVLIQEDKKDQYIITTKKTINRLFLVIPGKNRCLAKSIVFKLLLKSLGVQSEIVFSVFKSQNKFLGAHAFVRIDNNNLLYLKRREEILLNF